MKQDFRKIIFLLLLLTLSTMGTMADTLKGVIIDKQTKEPLTGATVQIAGTSRGAVADIDGNYVLEAKSGIYTLTVKYIGYKDLILSAIKVDEWSLGEIRHLLMSHIKVV